MGTTAELAEFCASLKIHDLPPEVIKRTRFLVLDLVGNITRGHDVESAPALRDAVRTLGLSNGHSRVIGDVQRYSPAGAALVSGTCAHSLDFDDTHAAGTLHPGAAVIPAALTAGELTHATGATVLAGIVAGYEVACRTALALPAGDHYERGFHPTATCGAFGAAAAAARVFGLDADGVSSALGIALSQSAGSLQFLANGAWTKRFQVGWAALCGLTAATLARAGFKGASEALEGKHGFLATYAPKPTPERVTQDLGAVFELMATGVKPYPSCRYGHAGIDGALALRSEHDLQPLEIESVTYGLSHAGMLLVGTPAARKQDPRNIVDGQFSAPFVLAVALATGRVQWDSYERLQDPVIRGLLPKIHCEHDPEIEAQFPLNMSGKITLQARGRTYVKKVIVPRGEPGNFLTERELRDKFSSLAGPPLGAQRAASLAASVLRLEKLPDVAELLALGSPAVD
jgi:2-methylcitrate dehydratase PrpD